MRLSLPRSALFAFVLATFAPALAHAGDLVVAPAGSCLSRGGELVCWGVPREFPAGDAAREAPFRVPLGKGLTGFALGDAHGCGVDPQHHLKCFGQRISGDLADPLTTPEGLPEVDSVAVGESHSCAVARSGEVYCWGNGSYGEVTGKDRSSSKNPVRVDGITDAVEVVAGFTYSCARTRKGRVACWGRVTYADNPKPEALKLRWMQVAPSARLDAERETACSLGTGGEVQCFGNLPLFAKDPPADADAVVTMKAPAKVRELAVSRQGLCVRPDDGTVHCTGYLANRLAHREIPPGTFVAVPGVKGAVAFDVGDASGCFLAADGALSCWGARERIGRTIADVATRPVEVRGLSSVVQLASADKRTCAVDAGGSTWCWGGSSDSATAAKVAGLDRVTDLALGHDASCARRSDGKVLCWAGEYGADGILGDAKAHDWGQSAAPPTVVSLGASATAVAVGAVHGCALTTAAALSCWGTNYHGVLGKPQGVEHPPAEKPALVAGVTGVRAIAVTRGRTCAALEAGGVVCLGEGEGGVLGNGSTTTSAKPVSVIGVTDVQRLSLDERLSCALQKNGTAACWGMGALTAVKWPGSDVVSVDTGPRRACVARATGKVECGLPGAAKLVPGLDDATQVAVGEDHACALRKAGTVACWGARRDGALGDGLADFIDTPMAVSLPAAP